MWERKERREKGERDMVHVGAEGGRGKGRREGGEGRREGKEGGRGRGLERGDRGRKEKKEGREKPHRKEED